MIHSAEEFVRLRTSERKEEYDRAAHDEAPLAVWWEVVEGYPEMKTWVVHNKTVPLEVLEVLSRDGDRAVRRAVAMKRKASPEMLERLARDTDEGVRYEVACNRKTPAAVLTILLDDDWDVIVAAVKARLNADTQ